MSSSNGSEINKESLFREWMSSNRWQQNAARRATHKALDIPEDMEINAQRTGIGAGGVAAIVAASTLGPAGAIGLAMLSGMMNRPSDTPADKSGPPAAVTPQQSDFEVRFFDVDGELIDIPQHSEL